ncbi:platelet glycoprotein Ib alpha chain-like isoform X2 [Palaemon carinicauda]
MRLEIANLPENQNDIPELSASVVHQQVVSGPPGHNSFPDSESSTSVVLQHVVTGPPAHGSFLAQESSTSVIPEQSVTGPPAHGSFLAQESSTSVIPEQAVNGPPTHGSSPAQESSTSVIPEQAVTGPPTHGSSPAQESSTSVIPEQAVTGPPTNGSSPAQESSTSVIPEQSVTGPPTHGSSPAQESSTSVIPEQEVTGPPTNGSSPAQESSTSVIPEQSVTGPPTHGSSPAQESSTSVIPEQAVTVPPGRGSFPANFSLYISIIYLLQNIAELKISHPNVEKFWEEFSRSNSSAVPVFQEDSKSTSKIRPAYATYSLTHPISQEDSESSSQTRPKYSLKFNKNTPSTKINSLIFRESFSVTKDSQFSPNPSQGNKITDIPSKEGFEMAKDSLHMNETHMNETGIYNIKFQPEGTSEDGGTTNSQRDAALTETTYRDGRTMFFIPEMECRYECHERSINSSDLDCFVDIECCSDRYCGEDYLKCLEGNLPKTNRNQSDNPNCHNATTLKLTKA